jgi:hypothetical protein
MQIHPKPHLLITRMTQRITKFFPPTAQKNIMILRFSNTKQHIQRIDFTLNLNIDNDDSKRTKKNVVKIQFCYERN